MPLFCQCVRCIYRCTDRTISGHLGACCGTWLIGGLTMAASDCFLIPNSWSKRVCQPFPRQGHSAHLYHPNPELCFSTPPSPAQPFGTDAGAMVAERASHNIKCQSSPESIWTLKNVRVRPRSLPRTLSPGKRRDRQLEFPVWPVGARTVEETKGRQGWIHNQKHPKLRKRRKEKASFLAWSQCGWGRDWGRQEKQEALRGSWCHILKGCVRLHALQWWQQKRHSVRRDKGLPVDDKGLLTLLPTKYPSLFSKLPRNNLNKTKMLVTQTYIQNKPSNPLLFLQP